MPGPPVEAAPSARDTLSMCVESFILRAGKVQPWMVQFAAPCRIQWIFPLPWVSNFFGHLLPINAPRLALAIPGIHTTGAAPLS